MTHYPTPISPMHRTRLAALALGLTLACSSTSPSGPTPVAINVTPDSLRLAVGDSAQLVAVVLDGDAHQITGVSVAFTSADTLVATVTPGGFVSAKHAGVDSVVASLGSLHTVVPIVVVVDTGLTKSIHVTPDSARLAIGDSLQLVTVIDSGATPVAGPIPTFVSRDTLVATVSVAGQVRGVGHGVDTITVSAEGLITHMIVRISSSRVAISGRPFGVAVSSLGQAYITRQDANALSRVIIGPDTVAGTVAVGSDPGDVTFNAGGTTAYVTNFAGGNVGRFTVGAASQSDSASVGGAAFHVRMSASGTHIFVASNNGFLYTLDATTLARVDSVAIDGSPNGLAIKGDTLAYVSSTATGNVTEIDLKGDSLRRTFAVGGTPQDVVLSSNGGTLFVANESGRLDFITLAGGTIGTPMNNMGSAFGLARTSAGDTLFLTSLDGIVRKIDGAGHTLLRTYTPGGTPRRVAVAADGTALVANEGNWVDIIR